MRFLILFVLVLMSAVIRGPSLYAGDSKLVDAVENRDFETAQSLLDQSVDVNQTQADGMNALLWATQHDNFDLAKRLVEAKADVNAKNRYEVSALSLACQNGNEQIVQLLLENGADTNTCSAGGESALMTAARTGVLAPVELLISKGANVNATESKGQTALMWAAAEGHAQVVDALLKAGADSNAKLKSGFTPIIFAARQGHTPVVLRLLAAGCDVNDVVQTTSSIRFGNGKLRLNPLLIAVENGHFELAETLLKSGADPNVHPSGYTPLHSLTWIRKPIRGDGDPSPAGSGKYTSLDMVRILIENGADINSRMSNGKTELGRFTYTGSTTFLLAAQAADVTLMKLLVELGADINIPNADGTTPLMALAGVGALGDGDESAGTEQETIAALEYLHGLKANVNAIDQNGETAMHGAAYQSLPKVVQWLASHGADIEFWNHENRAGWTPLKIAVGYRPGNFRPDPPTIQAIRESMVASKVNIPDFSKAESHERSWSATKNDSRAWTIKNLQYAQVDDIPLLLDLYLPLKPVGSSLIVWVHGGAWRGGSKDDMPLKTLVDAGYAVASVDYRLSPVAKFPAQVHDIKAAIRFSRFMASRYGYRTDRIAIAGSSAGGHLAALVGTTNNNKELEGTLGNHLEQSSAVSAIVDLFGPTDFMTIIDQSTDHGRSVRIPALQLLLGAQPQDVPDLAKLASPVEHIDVNDPPLLIIHGDQDPQVPLAQSQELNDRYRQLGLPVQMEVIANGVHGGKEFYDSSRMTLVLEFLEQNLRLKR